MSKVIYLAGIPSRVENTWYAFEYTSLVKNGS